MKGLHFKIFFNKAINISFGVLFFLIPLSSVQIHDEVFLKNSFNERSTQILSNNFHSLSLFRGHWNRMVFFPLAYAESDSLNFPFIKAARAEESENEGKGPALLEMKNRKTSIFLTDSKGNEVLFYRLRSHIINENSPTLDSIEMAPRGLDEMYVNMAFEDRIVEAYKEDPRLFREHLRIVRDEEYKLDHKGTSFPYQTLNEIDAANISSFGEEVINMIPAVDVGAGVPILGGRVGISASTTLDIKGIVNQSTQRYIADHPDQVYALAETVRKSLFFEPTKKDGFIDWIFPEDPSKEEKLSTALKARFLKGYGNEVLPKAMETNVITGDKSPVTFENFSILHPTVSQPYSIMKNSKLIESTYDLHSRQYKFLQEGQKQIKRGQDAIVHTVQRLVTEQIIYTDENGRQYTIQQDLREQNQYRADVKSLLLSSDPALTRLSIREKDAVRSLEQTQNEIDLVDERINSDFALTEDERAHLELRKQFLSSEIPKLEGNVEKAQQGIELLELDRTFKGYSQKVAVVGQIAQFVGVKDAPKFVNAAQGALKATKAIKAMGIANKLTLAGVGDIASGVSAVMSIVFDVPSADEMILERLGMVLENQKKMMESLEEIHTKLDGIDKRIGQLKESMEEGFKHLNRAMEEGFESVRGEILLVREKLTGIHSDVLGNRRFMQDIAQEEALKEIRNETIGVLSNFRANKGLKINDDIVACQRNQSSCTDAAEAILFKTERIMSQLTNAVTDTLITHVAFRKKPDEYFSSMTAEEIFLYLNEEEEEIEDFVEALPSLGTWLNSYVGEGRSLPTGKPISISKLEKAIHPGYFSILFQNYVHLALNLPIPEDLSQAVGIREEMDQLCKKAVALKEATSEMRKGLPLAWKVYRANLEEVKKKIYETIISSHKDQFSNRLGNYIGRDYIFASDSEISNFVNDLDKSNYGTYKKFAIQMGAVTYKEVRECIKSSNKKEKYCTSYKEVCHYFPGCNKLKLENDINNNGDFFLEIVDFEHDLSKDYFLNSGELRLVGCCGFVCESWYWSYPCLKWRNKNAVDGPDKSQLISKIINTRNDVFKALKQALIKTFNGKGDEKSKQILRQLALAKLAIQSLAYGGYGKHYVDYSDSFKEFRYELGKAPIFSPSGVSYGGVTWIKPAGGEKVFLTSNTSQTDFKKWMKWVEGGFKAWEMNLASEGESAAESEKALAMELPLDKRFDHENFKKAFFTVQLGHRENIIPYGNIGSGEYGQRVKSSFALGFGEPLQVYKTLETATKYSHISPSQQCIDAFELEKIKKLRDGTEPK